MNPMIKANLEILKEIIVPKIEAADQAGDGIAFGNCGERYGPIAHDLYHALYSLDNPITLSPWLAVNRFRMHDGGDPDSLEFWSHGDAILGLYLSLKKNGYYDGENDAGT